MRRKTAMITKTLTTMITITTTKEIQNDVLLAYCSSCSIMVTTTTITITTTTTITITTMIARTTKFCSIKKTTSTTKKRKKNKKRRRRKNKGNITKKRLQNEKT